MSAADVGNDSHIAMGGTVLRGDLRVVKPELEQRGQRIVEAVRANHNSGDARSIGRGNEDFVVDRVAPMVILCIEQDGQRPKGPIGIIGHVFPDQFHGVCLIDAVLGALLIKCGLQRFLISGRRGAQPSDDGVGVVIADAANRIAERTGKRLRKCHSILRLECLRVCVHVVDQRAPDRSTKIRLSPPLAQGLPRDIGSCVLTGGQLQRRQVREIPLRIRVLIDRNEPPRQIAHDRPCPGIRSGRGWPKIEFQRCPRRG